MRKHYKLISSIVCLLLCVSMIAFGVYAATHSLIGVNSQVSFTPTTAKLKIFGGIANHKEYVDNANSGKYYACNYGVNGVEGHYTTKNISGSEEKIDEFEAWNFEAINFDDNYQETGNKTKPKSIYFYIQVTNYVERNVKYSLKINDAESETGEKLDNTLELAFGYYLTNNDDENLQTEQTATTNGWWCITNEKASQPVFHSSNDNKLENINKLERTGNIVNFYKEENGVNTVDTTLSTMMIVIKMDVKSDEVSLKGVNFNFTLSAI